MSRNEQSDYGGVGPGDGNVVAKKISKVGDRSEDGTLRCPKCGGTSFENRRGLMRFVVGVFARKKNVRCQTCGDTFKRG